MQQTPLHVIVPTHCPETSTISTETSNISTHQVIKRFPSMPFTLRALTEGAEGDAKAELSSGQLRLGLVECLNHGLLHPYPVLHEKPGDLVAQIKGTVLLMPSGSDLVTTSPSQTIQTDKKVRG